jgi:hypothetical protein
VSGASAGGPYRRAGGCGRVAHVGCATHAQPTRPLEMWLGGATESTLLKELPTDPHRKSSAAHSSHALVVGRGPMQSVTRYGTHHGGRARGLGEESRNRTTQPPPSSRAPTSTSTAGSNRARTAPALTGVKPRVSRRASQHPQLPVSWPCLGSTVRSLRWPFRPGAVRSMLRALRHLQETLAAGWSYHRDPRYCLAGITLFSGSAGAP